MKDENSKAVDGIYRKALLSLLLCALLVSSLSTARASTGQDLLLETGSGKKPGTPTAIPAIIKIVSYNIRWRGGEDLRRLIELLRSDDLIGQAQIICLQEVDRNKKRTRYTNTARMMA